jgi:hypothetical protein
MATFLLAWNPDRWPWDEDDLREKVTRVRKGKSVSDQWSTGGSRRPRKGDQFYLIKLGKELPKGIIASGTIESNVFQDLHWDEEKAARGETTNYAKIRYDVLLDPYTEPILDRELLNSPEFSEMHWDTQMSGIEIKENVLFELESIWNRITRHRSVHED